MTHKILSCPTPPFFHFIESNTYFFSVSCWRIQITEIILQVDYDQRQQQKIFSFLSLTKLDNNWKQKKTLHCTLLDYGCETEQGNQYYYTSYHFWKRKGQKILPFYIKKKKFPEMVVSNFIFYAQSTSMVISGWITFCQYTVNAKKYVHAEAGI